LEAIVGTIVGKASDECGFGGIGNALGDDAPEISRAKENIAMTLEIGIVLGPASYPRSWSACRQFAGMRSELNVERLLAPGEVDQWIARLSSAR
jgi:hypothetical protein